MRVLASSIRKPGIGAATYGTVRALDESAEKSNSPAFSGSVVFVGSAISAGVALAAVTAASPAIVGITAAMAIAVVPSVGVVAGLYAAGEIHESTFNEMTALLSGVSSPEGLITTATLLSTGMPLNEALNHAESVSAVRSVGEGLAGLRTTESFADGYELASGFGSAVDLTVRVQANPEVKDGTTHRGIGSNRSKFSDRDLNDRGMSFGERAAERRAAREESRVEHSPVTSTKMNRSERADVRSETKPGKGEVRAKPTTDRPSGGKGGAKQGSGGTRTGPTIKVGPLG